MDDDEEIFVGEITDDFGYNWKFVKPRSTELKEHFTLSTMYKDQVIHGWVRKFPNWEERRRELNALTKDRTTRAEAASIHTVWSIKTLVSKYGADMAIRELKKRCDAGAIVGCSLYLNMSTHLIGVALGEETPMAGGKVKGSAVAAKDPAYRAPALGMLESAEGDKWVQKIEALHEQYPDARIPKNVIEDLKDEFRDELERKVGRQIPRLPEDATPQDIAESKKIAEQLAKGTFIKKPERQPVPAPSPVMPPAPIPTEQVKKAVEEKEKETKKELEQIEKRIEELKKKEKPVKKEKEKEKEKPVPPPKHKPELDLMEEEIKKRMEEIRRRRAAGEGRAGEPTGDYKKKGEFVHGGTILKQFVDELVNVYRKGGFVAGRATVENRLKIIHPVDLILINNELMVHQGITDGEKENLRELVSARIKQLEAEGPEVKYARIFGLPEDDIAHAHYDIVTAILTVTYGKDQPRKKQKTVTRKASKEFADFFIAPIYIGKSVDYILTEYLKVKGTEYPIDDIEGIRQAALKGEKKIWISNKGREGLILASKYGDGWWKKAARDDIERVVVYDSRGSYVAEAPKRKFFFDRAADDILGVDLDKYDAYEFGTRVKLQKKEGDQYAQDYILVSKHLTDAEYRLVKPYLKGVQQPRKDFAQMSYAELHFLISVEQDMDELKKLNVDAMDNITEFDKELLKEEISMRIQELLEHEEAGKPRAPEGFAEKAHNIQLKGYAERLKEKKEKEAKIGDPDAWIKSKGAAFHDEVRGAHHGQVDGTLAAYDANTSLTIGFIDYSLFEGKVYLDNIEVDPAHRRQGYATALLMKLKQLNPGVPVHWGMMTEEGCALKCATEKENVIMERGDVAKLSKPYIIFQIRAYRKSGKTKEELEGMTKEQLIELWLKSPRDEGYVAEPKRQYTDLEKAEALGAQAFKKGKVNAPALDKDFLPMLDKKQPGEALPYLEAWQRGWHKENARTVAKQIAATYPKQEGEKITLDDLEKLSPEKRRELAKKIVSGDIQVREDADVLTEPPTYKHWTFADFEPLIPYMDNLEDLEELYEFVGASEKLSETEADTLRTMIKKRMDDLSKGA